MRRSLATLVFALLCLAPLAAPAGAFAAPATAPAASGGPLARIATVPAMEYTGPTATISRGAPLTFAVRTTALAGTVTVRVAGALQTDDSGLLTGEEGTWLDEPATRLADGVLGWTVPSTSVLRQRPGTYYWQAYTQGDTDQVIGPVQKLTVTLPATYRGRGILFPRFGRKGGWSFQISSANLPLAVSKARFRTLARSTASRWNLRAGTWTKTVAGVQDGKSVAGFSPDVPDGVLGLETDFLRNGRVVERDLALNTAEDWDSGPDYPGLAQIDLESVMLHELGHMAGNKRHQPRCANSPMIEALGAGEWWRGARDHWFESCSATAARASSARLTLAHRVVRLG